MEKKLLMVGFTGLHRIVTECFLKDVFKPDTIENVETIDALFATRRNDPIEWIAYSLFSLGLEIEETLRRLTERYSESRHICYSEFPVADDIALRCKKSGAAYLICNLNTEAERKRLESSVALGHPWYPASISGLERKAEHAILARSSALTVRQHTVLRYALSGKTIKETAGELGVTEKTVSTHRAHYMDKLGTDSPCGQFATAVMMNLVSPFEVIRSLGAEEIG